MIGTQSSLYNQASIHQHDQDLIKIVIITGFFGKQYPLPGGTPQGFLGLFRV
jgi:hypothetical protein